MSRSEKQFDCGEKPIACFAADQTGFLLASPGVLRFRKAAIHFRGGCLKGPFAA
jgi:hypothetical protein